MRAIALVLVSFVCLSSARKLQNSNFQSPVPDVGEQMQALATLLLASHPDSAFVSSGVTASPVMGRQNALRVSKQMAPPATRRSGELLMEDKAEVGELVAYMFGLKDMDSVPDDVEFKSLVLKKQKEIIPTMLAVVGEYYGISFTADDYDKVTTVGAIKAKMR